MKLEANNLPPAVNVVVVPDGQVPIIVHTKLPGIPDPVTMAAEAALARDKRLFHHIAALSDVHKKKRIANPASSVVVSATDLIPQLIDAASNCGMRLMATDLTEQDVEHRSVERIFEHLVGAIPTRKYFGTSVPARVIKETFIKGSRPVVDHLGVRIQDEIANTYASGNLFNSLPPTHHLKTDQLTQVVPRTLIQLAKHRLGILGATDSHSVSLMKVDGILDAGAAKALGIAIGQYVFFMHTGSGIIGRLITHMYSAQPRRTSHNVEIAIARLGFGSTAYKSIDDDIKKAMADKSLIGFGVGTDAEVKCAQALAAAGNQGFANRTVISHNLHQSLERTLGRPVNLRLIYDTPHVTAVKETHFGKSVWVHRNGATRALGPSRMSGHDLFAKTGEPALIAPFENSFSYLGAGTDHNDSTFASANHELGKLGEITSASFKAIKGSTKLKLTPVKICRAGSFRSVKPKQLHANYAEALVAEIEFNQILKMVARFTPVATLTY